MTLKMKKKKFKYPQIVLCITNIDKKANSKI